MLVRTGFKRIFVMCMLMAAPLAYSEPISIYQEALPVRSPSVEIQKPAEVKELKTPKRAAAKKISLKTKLKAKAKSAVRSMKKKPRVARGIASWYSKADDYINKHTANGEVFNDRAMTCASWHHPFGTQLKVTNLQNGKSVVCRVNDRGPNKRLRREIDLTIGAFKKIASANRGLIRVSVTPQPRKAS